MSRGGARWLLPGVVLPALVALIYVYRFGVNVPAHDEWNFMPTVTAFYEGGDWGPRVLEHYSEHRIVLLKLIILGLSRVTALNTKVEMVLSALLMAASALLCWRLIRRTGGPAWAIVPVGWVVLSTGQYENLLVGWQLAIPLMNVFMLLAVLRLSTSPPHVPTAALAAVGATFSFASGMLIWPAGFLLLFARDRRWRPLLAWTAVGTVAVVAYRIGYKGTAGTQPGYLLSILREPVNGVRLFLALVGNSFGAGQVRASWVSGVVLLLLIAAGTLVLWRWDRLRETDAPWYALLAFSVASAFAVSLGRSFAWQVFVSASRYMTLTVFVPVAAVMISLRAAAVLGARGPQARRLVAAGGCLLVLAGAYRLFRTAELGWVMGAADRGAKIQAIPCLLAYRTAPAECLRTLYDPDPEFVRAGAATLERWGLGPFKDAPGAEPVRGNVDRMAGVPVVVEGWALTGDFRTPAAVILSVDGDWKAVTSRFLPRPDVGQFFDREVGDCGWRVALPPDLPPGRHRLQALVLPAGEDAPVALPAVELTVQGGP